MISSRETTANIVNVTPGISAQKLPELFAPLTKIFLFLPKLGYLQTGSSIA